MASGGQMVPAVEAEGLGKIYGGRVVLDHVDLMLAPGEVVALLGPSGCGKTTFLRLIAGLLDPDMGRLSLNGQVMAEAGRRAAPPEARSLGMVFQDYALWPHLSVLDNVAFPLRMRGIGRAARRARALQALERVGLAHLADRGPGTLSGGQQQRVALARAVVAEPPLVLFDEPLSNLDRELRESLAVEIGTLMRELSLSAVYVTHDQAEAFTIADRVAVMHAGRIAQIAAPETLFHEPASLEVARFLNIGAILSGAIAEGRFRAGGLALDLGGIDGCALGGGRADLLRGGPAHLLIPRTAIRPADAGAAIRARVAQCQFQGDRYMLHLDLEDGGASPRLACVADRAARPGEIIGLALEPARLRLFAEAA